MVRCQMLSLLENTSREVRKLRAKKEHPGESRGVREGACSLQLFFERSWIGQILRRLLIEQANEFLGRGRNGDGALANNSLRFNFLVVDPFVGVVVRPER